MLGSVSLQRPFAGQKPHPLEHQVHPAFHQALVEVRSTEPPGSVGARDAGAASSGGLQPAAQASPITSARMVDLAELMISPPKRDEGPPPRPTMQAHTPSHRTSEERITELFGGRRLVQQESYRPSHTPAEGAGSRAIAAART